MRKRWLLLGAVLLVAAVGTAHGDDWPQWRGPKRDGISQEKGLLKSWPKDGPKLLWKITDLGTGYSTPAIVGNRIYVQTTRGDEEFVVALDAANGKQVWSAPLGKVGKNPPKMNYPGSRATPTVDGETLYALGSDGDLVCLETASGKSRWHKDLRSEEFSGKPGQWVYSESVLVDGDLVVCTPGGQKATLAALDKKTGDVRWKSVVPGGDQAAYASIIVAQVGPVKQYVTMLQKGIVGVEAKTGRFLWRYDQTGKTPANIPTPVFHDGLIFTATSMGGGALLKLVPEGNSVKAEQVYYEKTLSNAIGGMVVVGDYLYGTGSKTLRCVEFKTGKIKWEDRSTAPGGIQYADGNLYVRGENDGVVALVEATPDGYREKGRLKQPDRTDKKDWPYPVVANGRLYLRDQGVLLCYDVKEGAK